MRTIWLKISSIVKTPGLPNFAIQLNFVTIPHRDDARAIAPSEPPADSCRERARLRRARGRSSRRGSRGPRGQTRRPLTGPRGRGHDRSGFGAAASPCRPAPRPFGGVSQSSAQASRGSSATPHGRHGKASRGKRQVDAAANAPADGKPAEAPQGRERDHIRFVADL